MLLFVCRLIVVLSISFTCSAFENVLSPDNFLKEWERFLSDKDIDYTQIGMESYRDYEFALLDEFSVTQNIRHRPYMKFIDRNKYCLPFLENRITLNDGTEMSASAVMTSNGYQHFIATQAPFKSNKHFFWQMVLENEIDQIVMVTEFTDIDTARALADPYWPQQLNEKIVLENGLEVTLLEERDLFSELDEYIQMRKFNLHSQEDDKIVTHYWYRNWIDGSAPKQSETILALINKVENDKVLLKSNAPILVHCSAGVGRTGVFLALYHLMQREKNNDQKINFFNFVAFLRWQRHYLVATPAQYKFCYQIYENLDFTVNDQAN